MSDPKETKTDVADEDLDAEGLAALEEEAPAMRALLKRSLEAPPAAAPPTPAGDGEQKELLAAVQRKLRHRSKGKFYGDGWSTTQSRVNYALVAAIMLVTIVAVYLALGPMGISIR